MAKSKQPGSKQDRQWAEAKRRCRLNREDIRMARELGLNPRSLIKNIPSPQQPWKLPVKQWIHELYEKKTGKMPGVSADENARLFAAVQFHGPTSTAQAASTTGCVKTKFDQREPARIR